MSDNIKRDAHTGRVARTEPIGLAAKLANHRVRLWLIPTSTHENAYSYGSHNCLSWSAPRN